MRIIDNELKDKLLLAQQTIYNDAQLGVKAIVSRATTVIERPQFLREAIVTPNATITDSSVAVRHQLADTLGDWVYAASIVENNLVIKKSKITIKITDMTWEVLETIADCSHCSLQFDGAFVYTSHNIIEFLTDEIPLLFYITTAGELKYGIAGSGVYETLIASEVTDVDVIMGIEGYQEDITQGMLVFYIIDGTVFYNSLIDGVFQGQQAVPIAPANAVLVHAERTFDYRIVLQVTDSSGALWEVFTKMEASSWNSTEFIESTLSVHTNTIPIDYGHYHSDNEHIRTYLGVKTSHLYALAPIMIHAQNLDDGNGNYGLIVDVIFDENVFLEDQNITAFSIRDDSGGSFASTSITKSGKHLLITFVDFNNLSGDATIYYTPGTLIGDVELVEAHTITFTPTGLVPVEINPPVPVLANIPNQETVYVSFDKPVFSNSFELLKAGFIISAQEYNMIPEGTASTVVYEVDSIQYSAEGAEETLVFNLVPNKRIKYPIGDVSIKYNKSSGNLVGFGNTQVDDFELFETATVASPVFNPNDAERISAAITAVTNLMQIYYEEYKEGEEYIQSTLTAASATIHINDIPT